MGAEEISSNFLKAVRALGEVPPRKSNNHFKGQLFLYLLFAELKEYIPKQYFLVPGGLWIRGLEWVEWDGAVVIKGPPYGGLPLYASDDIVVLFEVKAHGVYGNEKEIERQLQGIKTNFDEAKKRCPNLRRCIYVTLQERIPRKERSVQYYQLTKDILELHCLAVILFQSPLEYNKVKPYPGEWERLVEALKEL